MTEFFILLTVEFSWEIRTWHGVRWFATAEEAYTRCFGDLCRECGFVPGKTAVLCLVIQENVPGRSRDD